MERLPKKDSPRLFDRALLPIQKYLADNLAWLDHSIGFCEILTTTRDGRKEKSANLYTSKGEYIRIEPCDDLGNFCFWVLKDPQEVENNRLISAPFSLIFWYDMKKVSDLPDERNREAIKAQILALLREYHSPYFDFRTVYERTGNIFSDFSYDETQNYHLMSPYAGLRIDGEIRAKIGCFKHGGFVGEGDFNEDFNEDYK